MSRTEPKPVPPVARVVPVRHELHGHAREDHYHWMRERDDPEVRAYLEAENAYTEASMAHTKPLQERLYEEIKGRIKQTDMTVPWKRDGYWYYTRFEEGKEYPLHCRKAGSLEGEEQVLLDVNELARGHEFYNLGGWQVSTGRDRIAWAEDTVGRRVYTIRFKDLTTGETLPDTIPEVTSNLVWANDNRTLFYARQDPSTLRPDRILRHRLGTDAAADVLVYEERDEIFSTWVSKTRSRAYVLIGSVQTLTNEYRYLSADDPEGEFRVFLPRERGHEYALDHLGAHFYVHTNDRAKNFRIVRQPLGRADRSLWEEIVPHRDDVLIEGFDLFRDHLVVEERALGLLRIVIRPWDGRQAQALDFGEPAYVAWLDRNPEIETTTLRYGYASMTTPNSIYDYDMETREAVLLKREEVLGGFDPQGYRTERLHATAPDGESVPISLVYRKDVRLDGSAPLLLYGYGAYGLSLDAGFSSPRLSLVDRGFIYAIAHVRGGEELGRRWYDAGRAQHKQNSFLDFIACAEHLVRERYTRSERMFAMGGSAGGLLVGAVLNLRPELFAGAVAAVPFVDVVTTMLDDSLPLTTGEFDEWGDPKEKEAYERILSYSPYDNVRPVEYPHLLVTTGLHDSQVQYWEPAKWVAKLRRLKTGERRLLLKTELEAGHGGPSGRFKKYREAAFQFAFLLDLAGIRE